MYIGNKQNIALKLKILCSLQFLKNTKFVPIVLNPSLVIVNVSNIISKKMTILR